MSFVSLDFAVFLPLVFLLYWFIFNRSIHLQNLLIVIASYVFYGWWDWRFLFLMGISSMLDYGVGLGLRSENRIPVRKCWLWISIAGNLGLLGYFKYYNFFAESFADAISFFGYSPSISTLNIILPVGISFYTFQTMSYSIDVYRRKMEPTTNLIAFLAYVSFFPQLVAGPIERAIDLLPQFMKKRFFTYETAVEGLKQILWGLFKKMVIANGCGLYVSQVFNQSDLPNGSSYFIAALLFLIQLYADFSGYSDMAIGMAKLFGFQLTQNFAYPFFSRSIPEFFRKWHITLITWFREYLYFPLGGNRGKFITRLRNTFVVFTVIGFWHGANWTFVVWGALCAVFFIPSLLAKPKNSDQAIADSESKAFPTPLAMLQMISTFVLLAISGIFFRSDSMSYALSAYAQLFSTSLFSTPLPVNYQLVLLTSFLFIFEWINRNKQFALENFGNRIPKILRWMLYLLLVFITFHFAGFDKEFIYFQF
jgi:alginate O-acetyltransferase complex protein AlgI